MHRSGLRVTGLALMAHARFASSFTPVTVAGSVPCFVDGPVGAPAVIVIQEWWGVNDNVKALASTIAEKGGFRVLIPDIYKGAIGVDKEEASHMMGNLDFPGAVQEISQAAAYLKEEGSPSVGVTGFCMGGALTLGSLAASPDIACGAPFCAFSSLLRMASYRSISHRRFYLFRRWR